MKVSEVYVVIPQHQFKMHRTYGEEIGQRSDIRVEAIPQHQKASTVAFNQC